MNEVELKFRCDDLAAVRTKAEQLGFVFVSEKRQKDSYLIAGDRDAQGREIFFRVREQEKSASLDYHISITDIETQELETHIADPAVMLNILEKLHMPVVMVIAKHRITLAKGEMKLMLDEVEDLGSFVEIEIMGSGADELRLQEIARELGLADEIRDQGYPGLMRAARASRQR